MPRAQAALAAEREHQATRHQRAERIYAANAAVDEYMRASGTRDYQQAFLHVRRTQPDLFAGMHEPAGLAAANFNPFHDDLGRFTTSDRAAGSHSQHERPAQHPAGETAGQAKGAGPGKYDGKLTAGVYKEGIGDGDCLPAVMREVIAQLSKLQTDTVRAELIAQGAERYPDGSLQVSLRQLEQNIRTENPQYTYDFSTSKGGADPREGPSSLKKYGADSQELTSTSQIAGHLQDGPVLVAARAGSKRHAELITGVNSDGSFSVYNPMVHGGRSTIKASQILTSPQGNLLAFALTPLTSKAK